MRRQWFLRLTVPVLVLLVVSTGMRSLLLRGLMELNRPGIAARHCQNRFSRSCNGRCYIAQQLRKQQQPSPQQPVAAMLLDVQLLFAPQSTYSELATEGRSRGERSNKVGEKPGTLAGHPGAYLKPPQEV